MKPMMRGGRGHYRGRPEFKSRRGDQGTFETSNSRGRGGPSRRGGRGNRDRGYEVAGALDEQIEANSDEEVVLLDAQEMKLVETMKM